MRNTLLRWIAPTLLALAFGVSFSAQAQKVRLETSAGDIVIELEPSKAPKTVDNFLQYVRSGHYDGTIFHRVISNFMFQGGGF
jgi:peptidyl-prolyl cis-trans isomerase A (cyclophilin A)